MLVYVIGIGWVISMTGYTLYKKISKKNEVYYDLSSRVAKNKKFKAMVNENGKPLFKK